MIGRPGVGVCLLLSAFGLTLSLGLPSASKGEATCSDCHREDREDGGRGATSTPVLDTIAFTHASHESVDCGDCHDDQSTHGDLLVLAVEDCQGCHHDVARYPSCTSCHREDEFPESSLVQFAPLFSTGVGSSRPMTFEHRRHRTAECAACHGDPREAPHEANCASCHEDHHTSDTDCAACHVSVGQPDHPVAVHEGCSGSGCHTAVPGVDLATWTRGSCLLCHAEQAAHEPEAEDCSGCHAVAPIGVS